MAIITDKKQLCSVDLKNFKSLQGIGGKTLFERYPTLENIVNNNIDDKYKDFLARPVQDGNSITWFGKIYKETPQLLPELQDEKLEKYKRIKDETLAYYEDKINVLRQSGERAMAEFLACATKFINDRFIYCYDDIVVLGVWGMQLRDEVRESSGIVMKNLVQPVKPNPPVEQPPEIPEEPVPENIITPANVPEPVPVQPEPPVYPPKKRFRSWFTWKGFLKWLLWLLLLLLLLLLFWWLFRSCSGHELRPIPYPVEDKPWINDDPNVRDDGSIYNPGNPYMPAPTPPDYGNILPPQQGVLPPVGDDTEIIPGNPTVIGNRLNVLMENEDKSIMNLAKDFKAKYPDDKYKVVYYDDVIKRMQIEIPKEEREQLKQEIPGKFRPDYELFVFDEALFEADYTPDDPAFADSDKSWYLHAINAPKAWDITRGSPKLTVAIVDNGFNLSHPELSSKVVMPYNVWTHSDKIFPQQVDHGTHVAGTALAIADNGKGVCGIAPECAFMPVQVADTKGVMTTTSVLDGILYALYQGADVVNVSLGTSFASLNQFPENYQQDLIQNHFKEEERLWREIMRIAVKHNSTVVVAAGNDNVLAGIDAIQRPQLFVTVSAVDKNRQNYGKARFSNYGTYSTVSAPGVDIYSSIGKNGYQTMSGTSMAAPVVTGAIVLMKSLNDTLTTEQIICILQSTGLPAQGNVGNVIQLDGALEKVQSGEKVDCAEPPSPCNVNVASGGDEGYIGSFAMGQKNGSFVFQYDTKNVPDRITIYDGADTKGSVIFSYEGGTRRPVNTVVQFNEYVITVEIIGGTGTYWEFAVSCPGGQNSPVSNPGNSQNPNNPNSPVSNPGSPQNPNNPNSPYSGRSKDELKRERERLQSELDKVNEELKRIGN